MSKRVMSEEQKRKISLALKGKPKNYTADELKKRSERLKGNTLSLGRVCTEEMKEKIRLAQPNLGKKLPYKPRPQAKGKIPWNRGVPMSEETKQKLSIARKGRLSPWMDGNDFSKGAKNGNFAKIGSKHPAWVENKKRPFYKAIRELYQYRKWRSLIFERDRYTCVLCAKTNTYLHADHHPVRFIDIIRENKVNTLEKAINCDKLWDTLNGRTLCVECHLETETWGRKKN